jgi:hypothetical protein
MQNHADQRYMEIGFRLGHAGLDALLTAMPADTELTGIEFGLRHAIIGGSRGQGPSEMPGAG